MLLRKTSIVVKLIIRILVSIKDKYQRFSQDMTVLSLNISEVQHLMQPSNSVNAESEFILLLCSL